MNNDGFINSRTGKYVSSERAHQHVGENINSYEKRYSKNGKYYMASTGEESGLISFLAHMQSLELEEKCLDLALKSLCKLHEPKDWATRFIDRQIDKLHNLENQILNPLFSPKLWEKMLSDSDFANHYTPVQLYAFHGRPEAYFEFNYLRMQWELVRGLLKVELSQTVPFRVQITLFDTGRIDDLNKFWVHVYELARTENPPMFEEYKRLTAEYYYSIGNKEAAMTILDEIGENSEEFFIIYDEFKELFNNDYGVEEDCSLTEMV